MGSAFVFLYQRKSNISFQLSIMSCVLMDSTLIIRYLSYKGLSSPSLIWTGFSLCLLHPCPSGFISWVLCFLALIQFCFVLFLIPFKIFIYFWLPWVFIFAGRLSHCSEWGLLFVVMYGLVIAVSCLVVELRL